MRVYFIYVNTRYNIIGRRPMGLLLQSGRYAAGINARHSRSEQSGPEHPLAESNAKLPGGGRMLVGPPATRCGRSDAGFTGSRDTAGRGPASYRPHIGMGATTGVHIYPQRHLWHPVFHRVARLKRRLGPHMRTNFRPPWAHRRGRTQTPVPGGTDRCSPARCY